MKQQLALKFSDFSDYFSTSDSSCRNFCSLLLQHLQVQ